ncbi:MAG: alpha-L-fucosidase [Clostridiales bacterium]|nr:alpha-L-fucosidase [Clostridiales bacterium]
MKKYKKPAPRGDIINHSPSESYVWPADPEVLNKLEWFQDQKLGFMVHWGPYSQLGIVESWMLSDGDADWARRGLDWAADGEVRQRYFALNKTFNPLRFHPDDWADFAERSGFKYLVFTTKHHDGFCMYDTKYSDYRVTGDDCPFHTHPYADIARHLFDAFRARGLKIIPYFSKPDWHCPWYWAPGQALPVGYDRNPTYDPQEQPDLWDQFVQFTHAQMLEIISDLGPVEGLWLDGGQVNPKNGQDINMAAFAAKARALAPGLLIADRTVGGPYENYITPEQTVPDKALNVPWESCVVIGGGFSFAFGADYKSPRELVHLLMRVVSRGGNLALNLGAQPDGRLPRQGMASALKMGEWLKANGEAVYATRACAPYALMATGDGQALECVLTQSKQGEAVYAVILLQEEDSLPRELSLGINKPVRGVSLVETDAPLPFTAMPGGVKLTLPDCLLGACPPALALKLKI